MLCTIPAVYYVMNDMSPGLVFLFALLAIAPFAERLSFVTEQLALHTSETLGGLCANNVRCFSGSLRQTRPLFSHRALCQGAG